MQEDTSFRGDVIGLCISIKGRHTEGKGRHQRGLSFNIVYYCELYLFGYATLTTHPPPYALSVYCILYVYMYIVFYRLLSKTHSPLNRSQKLPAPYKQLIDKIKQNYLRENDWRTDNLTNNRQLLTVTIDGSRRTNDITSLHSR